MARTTIHTSRHTAATMPAVCIQRCSTAGRCRQFSGSRSMTKAAKSIDPSSGFADPRPLAVRFRLAQQRRVSAAVLLLLRQTLGEIAPSRVRLALADDAE